MASHLNLFRGPVRFKDGLKFDGRPLKVNPTLDGFHSQLSSGKVIGWYFLVLAFLEATPFSG